MNLISIERRIMSTSRGEGTFQRKKKKVEKLAWPQRLAMSIDDELDVSNQVHGDRVGTDHTGDYSHVDFIITVSLKPGEHVVVRAVG